MAEWSDDELATLPQTEAVFERPPMQFDNHQWQQEGYMITDVCNPANADCQHIGIPIPSGKMLVKQNGRYDIVSEKRS